MRAEIVDAVLASAADVPSAWDAAEATVEERSTLFEKLNKDTQDLLEDLQDPTLHFREASIAAICKRFVLPFIEWASVEFTRGRAAFSVLRRQRQVLGGIERVKTNCPERAQLFAIALELPNPFEDSDQAAGDEKGFALLPEGLV